MKSHREGKREKSGRGMEKEIEKKLLRNERMGREGEKIVVEGGGGKDEAKVERRGRGRNL